jgi:SP family general alpha glucoside:H+ symporter-like MFS transporter
VSPGDSSCEFGSISKLISSNIAPAYASEVAPIALRGILTIYVQICWCIGQFVSSGVTFGTQNRADKVSSDNFAGTNCAYAPQWAYKIPFAVQWVWPVPLLVILYFAPESPWWLVRKGRLEEAEKEVSRLASGSGRPAHETVSFIVRTNELEMRETEGSDFRRTA